MKKLILACFVFVALGTTPALAQLNANTFSSPQVSIVLQPEFPRPGEEVTATLNDYTSGTYGSAISWLLDGKEIPNTENQREVVFTAGPNNVNQIISVVLTKPSGGKEVIQDTIRPTYLDIVIEPQTRVPDFYLGRSLPSLGSLVNATALVGDNKIAASQLIYTWKINNTVIEGGPIRGRNQVSFAAPMGNTAVLSVRVTDLAGNTLSSRAILVPSVIPELHFYEKSTLFGISQKIITAGVPIIGQSLTIQAEPYYLDSRVYNEPDIKEWKIDNKVSSNTSNNPYEVTLQRVGLAGVSELQFHVRDTKQVLQGAKASIKINF